MKKTVGLIAVSMLLAAPVLAADAPTYNCDYEPSCEVAPGIYGAMASPVKSKFDLSIGGYVKLDYAYNSVNLGANGWLLPSGVIPKTNSIAGREDQSIFSARQSRLWFKVAGPTFLGAKTGALIEMDFNGTPGVTAQAGQPALLNAASNNENGLVRMRHAYGTLDWANTQLLFGQTQDIFGPMIANTVDNRGGQATGNPINQRLAQLRLTRKVPFNADNSLKLVLGIQNPTQDSDTVLGTGADTWGSVVNVAGQAMFMSNALGKAPGFYGLAMNGLTVGAFGLVGSEKVGLPNQGAPGAPGFAGNNKAVDSYGYGLYAFVPVLRSSNGKNRAMTMSLETQAYMASNMTFNSATGNAFAANGIAGTTTVQGSRSGAKGYGVAAQAIFYPTQDIGFTAGYQRRNAYNYGSFTAATTAGSALFEKSNSLLYANVAYDLNAAVRVAAEYENQNTQYGNIDKTAATAKSGATGSDNTLRLALYYFF